MIIKNPLIYYVYTRPLIKRCAKEFSLNSTDKSSHICNTAIVKKNIEDILNSTVIGDNAVYFYFLLYECEM